MQAATQMPITVSEEMQPFSLYPAIPPPVDVRLTVLPPGPCPYNAARVSQLRAILASRMEGDIYHGFMDAGFRRSGRMIYQPVCAGCRRCTPIRVPVASFAYTKSHRRLIRRNSDLSVMVGPARLNEEKYLLYQKYLGARHDGLQDSSREGLEAFLYDSPVDTVEFEYRLADSKLIAVGICDFSTCSLSSVYFYFDPDFSRRGLGNFGVLQEIAFCRQHGLPHLYLGYWIVDAPSMHYKARFRPFELLDTDGVWRIPEPIRMGS